MITDEWDMAHGSHVDEDRTWAHCFRSGLGYGVRMGMNVCKWATEYSSMISPDV